MLHYLPRSARTRLVMLLLAGVAFVVASSACGEYSEPSEESVAER